MIYMYIFNIDVNKIYLGYNLILGEQPRIPGINLNAYHLAS